jgi:hypothetical protein
MTELMFMEMYSNIHFILMLLTLQRGVPSVACHNINITGHGEPSTTRILSTHTSTTISCTFMKHMQSGLFCLVGKVAGIPVVYNMVLKINFLLLFLALKYQSIYLHCLNESFVSCFSLSNKCEAK